MNSTSGHPCRWLTLPVIALLGAMTLAASAPAQDEKKVFVPLDGTQTFANLLHLYKLKPLAGINDITSHIPRETLLVVFGDPSVLPALSKKVGGFAEYARKGGALLVASDRHAILAELGTAVTGETIAQVPVLGYHNIGAYPLIQQSKMQLGHPIFKDVAKPLVTSEPSRLTVKPSKVSLRALANFSQLDLLPSQDGLARCFMAATSAAPAAEERVLVIAGHSVFINLMMVLKDGDNFRFTENCLEWLSNGRTRKYCLFVEEGKVQSKFNVSVSQFPPLPLSSEEKIEGLLQALQTDNMFNRLLLHYIPKDTILHYLFIGVSVLVLGWLLWRTLKGRYAAETGLPLTTRTLEVTTTILPLMQQRYDLLARRANLTEIASSVARQWLAAHGLGETREQPPHAEATGSWWARRGWQRQMNTLWELAWRSPKLAVRPRDFRALLRRLEQTDRALRRSLAAKNLSDKLPSPPYSGERGWG